MGILCLFMEDKKPETKVYCQIKRGRNIAAILRRLQGLVSANIRSKVESLVKQEAWQSLLTFSRGKFCS